MSPSPDTEMAPPERDALAGEYVLGLIEGADLAAFVRRLDGDRELAASVEGWRRHFSAIDATAPAIVPSASLWPRIEGEIEGLARSAAKVAAATPAAASPVRPPRVAQLRPQGMLASWWNSLFVWRGAAMAGALAAIVLAIGLVGALEKAKRQPLMVAVLLTEASVAAAVVNTFSDGRVEMVPLQNIAIPEGKALEIWTLWDKSVGPRSVGVIQNARSTTLKLDQLPLGKDQLFEITIENATGSPTGRPTGQVVAKGTTAQTL